MSSMGASGKPGVAMVVAAHHPMFRARRELYAVDSSLLYNSISGNPGELFPMLDALGKLNRKTFDRFGDPETQTRISQYEMAFRMQSSVPEGRAKIEGKATYSLVVLGCGLR